MKLAKIVLASALTLSGLSGCVNPPENDELDKEGLNIYKNLEFTPCEPEGLDIYGNLEQDIFDRTSDRDIKVPIGHETSGPGAPLGRISEGSGITITGGPGTPLGGAARDNYVRGTGPGITIIGGPGTPLGGAARDNYVRGTGPGIRSASGVIYLLDCENCRFRKYFEERELSNSGGGELILPGGIRVYSEKKCNPDLKTKEE